MVCGIPPPSRRDPRCNDLTYDDGFGIWLVNTHDVVIDHATADANDTGGYVLDGQNTYHVTLENSGAQGNGSVRADLRPTDIPLIEFMLAMLAEYAHPVRPGVWRRYLAIIL